MSTDPLVWRYLATNAMPLRCHGDCLQATSEDVAVAALEGMVMSKQRVPDLTASFTRRRTDLMATDLPHRR